MQRKKKMEIQRFRKRLTVKERKGRLKAAFPLRYALCGHLGMGLAAASAAKAIAAAEEQQKDDPAAIHAAAASIVVSKSIAAATAGQKQDDPEQGTAVSSKTYAVFAASASTVCSS